MLNIMYVTSSMKTSKIIDVLFLIVPEEFVSQDKHVQSTTQGLFSVAKSYKSGEQTVLNLVRKWEKCCL